MVLDHTSQSPTSEAVGRASLIYPLPSLLYCMDFINQIRVVRTSWLKKVKKLNITPIELELSLIKPITPIKLTHHNYPLTKPIIVQKLDESKLYKVRDGNHRVQQAWDLGNTKILSIIVPS